MNPLLDKEKSRNNNVNVWIEVTMQGGHRPGQRQASGRGGGRPREWPARTACRGR